MNIYGVRIYPQSVKVVKGDGASIYVHGSVNDECSDFFYTFRPLAHLWRGHFFSESFGISYDESFQLQDPIPGLRLRYGSSLVAADLDSQLMLLRGDDFVSWGPSMYFCEGALLTIFQEPPPFELLKRLYRSQDFGLTCNTWPREMRSVLHMWDDIYWQLFSTERSDIECIGRAHAGDPKLKLFFVDLDREFPDPSNQELQPVTLPVV